MCILSLFSYYNRNETRLSRMQELRFQKRRRRNGRVSLKKRREQKFARLERKHGFWNQRIRVQKQKLMTILVWVLEIMGVSLAAFLLVWSFGQRVSQTGESMRPTLENGDVVLVNRLAYQIFRPNRGDLVVFLPDGNESAHFSIKRVVGLPGEEIQIKEGTIYINGEPIDLEFQMGEIVDAGLASEPIVIPKQEYFVLGDDPSKSDDSRKVYIGTVKLQDIYGKPWFLASFGERFGWVK